MGPTDHRERTSEGGSGEGAELSSPSNGFQLPFPNPTTSADQLSYDRMDYFSDNQVEDLSYADLDTFPDFLLDRSQEIRKLSLDHNAIRVLPRTVGTLTNLVALDISNNGMTYLSPEIVFLRNLVTLVAKNNNFENDALPKEMGMLTSLRVLNLSGNRFTEVPLQLTELSELRSLTFGANQLETLPSEIANLFRLEALYVGGNQLQELPEEVGRLRALSSLSLCDNSLVQLPRSLASLRNLQSLSLHNNQLSTLPPDILNLNLVELSLRNNPLVVRFVQDMVYEAPSLLELAGRVIRKKKVPYMPLDLPYNLIEYLESAQECVNPKCKGVYFNSHVQNIRFVDFCGKYRLPLLEYLCSPRCTTRPSHMFSSDSESDDELPVVRKMKKVLLG